MALGSSEAPAFQGADGRLTGPPIEGRATKGETQLTAVDGRPTIEAASQLGMTLGAVPQAKSKALRRLRDELGDAN